MISELLSIKDLSVTDESGNILLHPVSLTISSYRTLGIVGESGSGKSLMAKAIMGLLPNTLQVKGDILFCGRNLIENNKVQWQQTRGKEISLIIQNAMGAFDPLMTLKNQFTETLKYHTNLNNDACFRLACECLEKVNIKFPEQKLACLPHQLSGGQLQRMMIAITLALKPALLIADEPTTALDTITQSDILQQFIQLADEKQSTLVFISHDLGLVRKIADDIAVMYQGKIVEYQDTESLWRLPQHWYTRFLLDTRKRLSSRFKAVMEGTCHASSR
ncbi:ABC transporter ATP-binding protein [Morganella morganii]|uniref:ABC transporter ATP-binding protein n=1 Tax=Morganella morganii TaxID=582 RepID=UPI001C7CB097|nr:ABC transporter ATP-binding protein [Morganella morganii]GIZ29324.1 ABC transporter ATP-binding protein [Morganella morganii]GIZ32811.1 ABC transporter ATP-binding protein [Morganella morganii]GIZ36455.1 ABC transporter ATP-binding protein [Morganella morganii]